MSDDVVIQNGLDLIFVLYIKTVPINRVVYSGNYWYLLKKICLQISCLFYGFVLSVMKNNGNSNVFFTLASKKHPHTQTPPHTHKTKLIFFWGGGKGGNFHRKNEKSVKK